jgi:hypothetical protein
VVLYGPKYGTWTPWGIKVAHRADIAGFPRGRLVVEAQVALIMFLQKPVELLLNGMAEEEPPSNLKWYLTMRPPEANKLNIANIVKSKSCIASTDLILSRLYVTSIEGIRCVGNPVVSARYIIDVSASVNFPIKSPAALDKISSTSEL